jgi:hypothetical protein
VLPGLDGGRAIPEERLSNHSRVWDAGLDALMVTDNSFMRNPNDHRSRESFELPSEGGG